MAFKLVCILNGMRPAISKKRTGHLTPDLPFLSVVGPTITIYVCLMLSELNLNLLSAVRIGWRATTHWLLTFMHMLYDGYELDFCVYVSYVDLYICEILTCCVENLDLSMFSTLFVWTIYAWWIYCFISP